jgi:hypothetical protein
MITTMQEYRDCLNRVNLLKNIPNHPDFNETFVTLMNCPFIVLLL